MGAETFAKGTEVQVLKIDEQLGLVIGWAIVCKQDEQDYFDLQGDNIPEDEMLRASLDFMQNSRAHDAMHDEEQAGSVVFAFPLTTEVQKALGILSEKTGLIVGVKPTPEVFAKYRSGELRAFSIFGEGVRRPVVAE